MAEQFYGVDLTAGFLERLGAIEAFLTEAEAAFAFDDLLAELRATAIPNLARFPRIRRRYLDHPPQSAEALTTLSSSIALPAAAGLSQQPRRHRQPSTERVASDSTGGVEPTAEAT